MPWRITPQKRSRVSRPIGVESPNGADSATGCPWAQPCSCSPNPHAVSRARRTSPHRVSGRLQTTGPNRLRCASATWSKLIAQSDGMPSSAVRTTSVVRPLIVRVAGATMISFRRSITVFRVRIRTGRRLSGKRNVYQANLAAPQPRFSQPSASQASASSSAENSSRRGGTHA